ncbi:hypothetical protein [Pyramidobacter piscolens]|uniref:hypothetical protein n=1 Tax=Pyramidobacter piscolens TaxID=638849 RepID=UPI002AB0D42B|nr:hypothetical protein [Pyramidobacter piscolens]
MIITVKILKKGRKYWAAATDPKGWACKVVINGVSKDFEPGQIVSLDAEDVGTKTRWGSTYIYDPAAIATPELIAHRQALADARKWLRYAEDDTEKGWDLSNAINRTLDLDIDTYPEIADRLEALRQKVAENKAAHAAAVEARKKRQAERLAAEAKAREEEHAAAVKAREEKLGKRVLVNADDCPSTGRPWRMHNRPNGKIIVIESYGKKWYLHSEDACCYGMMPDDQWVRYAYYRDATPEEIAAVEAAEEAARKAATERKARSERLYEIKSAIRKAEHYAKDVDPADLEGEIILDTFNIYGGGERFVAADKWLWYIDNNGGDGDDWSVTNVYGASGTPGGIGWRIPRDESLVAELRELANHA